jgi:hypothetical protein
LKILFLTTTDLCCNPRLYKEAKTAEERGHSVTIICFKLNNWSASFENEYETSFSEHIEIVHIDISRRWIFLSLISVLISKVSNFLLFAFPSSLRLTSFSLDRRSFLLLRKLMINNFKADCISGHNIGALYPAYRYGRKKNIEWSFDVEDYHPYECETEIKEKRTSFLMKQSLPVASFISYSSEKIDEKTNELIKETKPKGAVICNSFFKKDFCFNQTKSSKVEFVWFSQNINYRRGLETILPCLAKFESQINLTLIGNLNSTFQKECLSSYSFVKTIFPLQLEVLLKKISDYDIGLALEYSNRSFYNIALSNKLLTYFQSGLYILASATSGQSSFLEKYPSHGTVTDIYDPHSIEYALENIIANIHEIRKKKSQRFNSADHIAYENQVQPVIEFWNSVCVKS